MKLNRYLILCAVLLCGIYPVFAQNDGKPVNIIDLEGISVEDLDHAMRSANDLELVNRSRGELSSGRSPAGAATEATAGETAEETAAETAEDSIRYNQYFQESQRQAKLAAEAYEQEDYDDAAAYARESIRYAELSDEYIALQLAIDSMEKMSKETAEKAPTDSMDKGTSEQLPLPARYAVRSWGVSKDCFWNIAAYPWVYGDPHQWRVLYNANKSKLPDPNNPNLIEPGIVLDIPSIKGETRQGAWDSSKTYTPIN